MRFSVVFNGRLKTNIAISSWLIGLFWPYFLTTILGLIWDSEHVGGRMGEKEKEKKKN